LALFEQGKKSGAVLTSLPKQSNHQEAAPTIATLQLVSVLRSMCRLWADKQDLYMDSGWTGSGVHLYS